MCKNSMVLIALLLAGCANNQPEQQSTKNDTINNDNLIPEPSNDYAIKLQQGNIGLREWEHEIKLTELLGKPDSQSTKILGDGADTHTGATIKTTAYDGLKIDWYIPKGKRSGWVLNMIVTDAKYETSRHVKTGDAAQRVKERYFDGTVFPDGRKEQGHYAWYISNDNNVLKFELANDTVSKIEVYHEIP